MKKFLLTFLILLIAVTVSVYALIPDTIKISEIVYAGVKSTSILRALHNDVKWEQWFPGKTQNGTGIFRGIAYTLSEKQYTARKIVIRNQDKKYTSAINVFPVNGDSSALQWKLELVTSKNPFKRIQQYGEASQIKNSLTLLLDSFKTFVQSPKNIYGFDIKYTTLTDTTLVSIKTSLLHYPSTTEIYSLVEQLRTYINQQKAEEHNYPMLNVTQSQDGSYSVMVGIPTNVPLKGTGTILPKRMMMIKNKTLLTEVTGDTSLINKALQATNLYMHDYELSAPVIPFQQLITDRRKEKDSTKWITRIFSPIA